MDRLEPLRKIIDDIVRQNPDLEESRCGFVHLYGVSAICTILALRRDLDPELCSAAGMLHDIWNYQVRDCPEHGELGAVEAEKILNRLGTFSQGEIRLICQAIARHADKQAVDDEMDELLKDADVFQHYVYNLAVFADKNASHLQIGIDPKPMYFQRLERVLAELGLA